MFQRNINSNCVVHFAERFLSRRYQQSKSTNWIGLDKYQKILYGIQFTEFHKWELRKLNIFTKTVNVIKTLYFVDFTHISVQINEPGDFLVFICYNENSNQSNMAFCLLSIETGDFVKDYQVSYLSPNSYYSIEHIDLIRFSNTSWVIKIYYTSVQVCYYHLQLDDVRNEGFLLFITMYNANHNMDVLRQYRDLIYNEQILFTMTIVDDSQEVSLMMYDMHADKWSDQILIIMNDVPICIHGVPVGYDVKHFFTVTFDSKKLMKYSINSILVEPIELEIPFTYLGFGFPFYAFTTANLFFIYHTVNDVFDKERIEFVILNHNVLSLKDLAIMRIAGSCRIFFSTNSEKRILHKLELPKILVREYFGPQWALKDQCC